MSIKGRDSGYMTSDPKNFRLRRATEFIFVVVFARRRKNSLRRAPLFMKCPEMMYALPRFSAIKVKTVFLSFSRLTSILFSLTITGQSLNKSFIKVLKKLMLKGDYDIRQCHV